MRYRKNIKGGEKKIIDQKAILKTVSRGTALFFGGGIVCGKYPDRVCKYRKNRQKAGKTTAVPIMRLQLRSTVKPDR